MNFKNLKVFIQVLTVKRFYADKQLRAKGENLDATRKMFCTALLQCIRVSATNLLDKLLVELTILTLRKCLCKLKKRLVDLQSCYYSRLQKERE